MRNSATPQMGKHIRTHLSVLTVWFSWIGVASAHSVPVWEEFKEILCQAQNGQICDPDLGQCASFDAKWVIRFNFAKNEVLTLGNATGEAIDSKYACTVKPKEGDGPAITEALRYYCDARGGLGSVFRGGDLFSFTTIGPGSAGRTATIEGVEQSSSRDHIYNVHFICHPE